MIGPKYQLPTDASGMTDAVGRDVAAEIGKIKGADIEFWTLPTSRFALQEIRPLAA